MEITINFVNSRNYFAPSVGVLTVIVDPVCGVLDLYRVFDPDEFQRQFLARHCRFETQGVLGCAITQMLRDLGLNSNVPRLRVRSVLSSPILGIRTSYPGDSLSAALH